jgi:hypothetical protein
MKGSLAGYWIDGIIISAYWPGIEHGPERFCEG